MELSPVIVDVLTQCQSLHPSFVVGGYLRDTWIGIPPSDVDIATGCTVEELESLFPRLSYTESGREFGVSRLQYKGVQFEFSSHDPGELLEKHALRDFTMNALLHDGEELHDPFDARSSIEQKEIRSLEPPLLHFKRSPQAFLRALRLSSTLGFTLSPSLIEAMSQNQEVFFLNTINRIQQEGYRILSSPFPLYSFSYLMEIGLLDPTPLKAETPIPLLSDNLSIRLTYLSEWVGWENIEGFVTLFSLSGQLLERASSLRPYLDDEIIPTRRSLINHVLMLKKYQYNGDIDRLRQYLEQINKKR